jgi:pimeloyl-ACP methyl ester carboxylesterase
MEAESLPMIEVDGARIGYRRIGEGRPLLVLNGFGATSADWDPSFIDRLACSHELILLNNRAIGGSTDDGHAFDIAKLATDSAHVIETLGIERASVMGWSMGGFIAQAFALNYADRVDKLVLLSTDFGGIEADLASPDEWAKLIDTSDTPNEQARRLLFLFFQTTWPNVSTASLETSWQRRAHNYPLTSKNVRLRRWTHGIAMASRGSCERYVCRC